MTLRIVEHAQRSDTGRVRPANEDSFLARPPLFVVADGMGGASAGEVASRLAVETFAAGLPSGGQTSDRLAEVVRVANQRIHEQAQVDQSRQGMGTTLTAAMIEGDQVVIAHVGDSRAYRFRDGRIERLTEDHTLVDELVRQGQLTEEEAAVHPQRSIITRALGPEPQVEVDTANFELLNGDVLLLCSDGLTGMVSEPEIESALDENRSLNGAARTLIRKANEAGGRDNITVVLFKVGSGAASLAPSMTMGSRGKTGGAAVTQRRGNRRGLAAIAAVSIILVLLAAGVWRASRGVFFLGTNSAGALTVYQGLPYELPGGIDLYEEWYASGVPASSLSPAQRKALLDHRLRSKRDISDLTVSLERGDLRR